mgnify:CR=1 FL=1
MKFDILNIIDKIKYFYGVEVFEKMSNNVIEQESR